MPNFKGHAHIDASTGKLYNPELSAITPQWIKIATKSFTDFAIAGLVNTIASGYSLPAQSVIHAVWIKPTTTFSGGTIASYTISVGVGSGAGVAKYFTAASVFTGVSLVNPLALIGIESVGSPTSITLTATSTVGLLNAADQGDVEVWALVSTIAV